MKPVAKVLVLVAVLGFLLLGSAVVIGACAVSHLHFGNGSFHSGVEANRVETHELVLDAGQPLHAEVDCGSIRVAVGEKAVVLARLRAFAEDKEAAEKRLATLSLELAQNSVAGRVQHEKGPKLSGADGGAEIDLELTLPAGTRLVLHSGSGDVVVQGAFGETLARSDYGDLEAGGIRGALVLESSSGDIRVGEMQGGNVRAHTDYGDIALSRIQAERIEASTSSGDIDARGLRAAVRLESSYGDVAVRELEGDLDSKTSSGEVTIREASGACRAHSDYGDVAAEGVFAGLSLSSSSGSVSGKAGPGSRLGSGWELSSDYGDVALALPEGLSFELDASTDFGEVRAKLPGALGGAQGDETKRLHGAVGQGGPRLRLHTSSGDVSVATH